MTEPDPPNDDRLPAPAPTAWERLQRRMLAPVDIASLVYFRLAFAGVMVWHCFRYLNGTRIQRYFVDPPFNFKYYGFEWVQPWAGDGMFIHFWLMGVLAVFLGIGLFYRLSAVLFFLAITYVFLLEQALYLNHMYFVSLVAFTMIFVPVHRAASVDGWRLGAAWRRQTAPAWALWVLRIQMGFVYFYAGLAKLNGDWMRGYPLRQWLQGKEDVPLIGPFLGETATALFMSWSGMLLDVFIVPALLWRRTRPYALLAAVAFHGLNTMIFSIGIFPHFSVAATLLFLDPDWPRRLLRRPPVAVDAGPPAARPSPRQSLALALVVAYVAIQTVIPLRPYFYTVAYGLDPSWSEEGHRFSWRQKLRGKNGYVRFLLTDPSTGESWVVDPRPLLTTRQYRKMSDRPYLIHQFALHLSETAGEEGKPPIEVRASAMAGLNGREIQPLIDSSVDLASQPKRFLTPHPWVLPLEVPLEAQWDEKSPPKHPATIAAIEKHKRRFRAAMEADVKAHLEARDAAAEGPEGPEE